MPFGVVRQIDRQEPTPVRPVKSHKKVISETRINEFINYIYTLNAADFPAQQQIINQMQKYKRNSRITSVLMLYNIFLTEK